MTITATIAGALSMLANFAMFFGGNRDNPMGFIGVLLVAILAPVGAEICGLPLWLAAALSKLEQGAAVLDNGAAERERRTRVL